MNIHAHPGSTVTEPVHAIQAAKKAITDWKVVAADPKGADGNKIQYNEANRAVLRELREEARKTAFYEATLAGFDISPIVYLYQLGKLENELQVACAMEKSFNNFVGTGKQR